MTIFDKDKISYNWAKSICEKLVLVGKIRQSDIVECIENAMREYRRRIDDIDEKYLKSIIDLDPELAIKIINEYKRMRYY